MSLDGLPSDGGAERALRTVLRAHRPELLAPLVRMLRDVASAEDCLQDASVRALGAWRSGGVPEHPRAWLSTAARNRAIDELRTRARRAPREASPEAVEHAAAEPAVVDDDPLALLLLCCHPSLAMTSQAALALHHLSGLRTDEIARALLVGEEAMGRRLRRASERLRAADAPFAVPPAGELPARARGAAAAIYLLFNEGYAATDGPLARRDDLADEALRLARLLAALLPDQPAARGLLALVLLQHARRDARTTETGELVLLAEQDRDRWDRGAIEEGVAHLGAGLARSPHRPDPYVVQAAIAACHAIAPNAERTDWEAIVSWYDVLLTVQDTPVVRLNRAVALGERDGPRAGLQAASVVEGLDGYPLWHAACGELLARCGDRPAAALRLHAALGCGGSAPLRRRLRRRLRELTTAESA